MYAVIFEVHPDSAAWNTYLSIAKGLKPQLEAIEGFISNVRYRSLTRDGWLLSLSDWEDEKALVRWRTLEGHHSAQEKGRAGVLSDYHLRVGEISQDSNGVIESHRKDLTEVGEGQYVTMHEVSHADGWAKNTSAENIAKSAGVPMPAQGLLAWDVLDAILTPGDLILLCTWKDEKSAAQNMTPSTDGEKSRTRTVRIIRDYGKYDRREAPQFYPDAEGAKTIHS